MKHLCATVLLLIAVPALAQSETVVAPTSLLPTGFVVPPCPCESDLIAAAAFPPAQVGYVLFDPADGSIVAGENLDQAFIPASVMKVPTMLMALEVLGPEHRFETDLLRLGKISSDGSLTGDLYLKGGGDPFLTSDDVLNFVLALKDRGVTKVEGQFLYDETALVTLPQINDQQPLAVPYNPGVSALSLNFNIIEMTWVRDGTSGLFAATALTKSDTLDVPVEIVTFDTLPEQDNKKIPFLYSPDETTGQEIWELSPQLPDEGEASLPVKNPGLNAAAAFRRLAEDNGITLESPLPGVVPEDAKLLHDKESVALDQIVKLILRYSNNLSAELMGLAATYQLTGEKLDLVASSAELSKWLKEKLPDVDWTGFVAVNHSGLSSASRVTPRQMAALLTYAQNDTAAGFDFYSLLAQPKWQDDLNEERAKDLPEIQVRAKSGTIHYARALTGYILTKEGKTLGFALFINDQEARAAYDATLDVNELAEVPGAKAWMKRAKELEQALVKRWALGY